MTADPWSRANVAALAGSYRARPGRPRTPVPAFGAELRRLRTERGPSAAALARAIGTGPGAVSRWECGNRLPPLPALARLAGALGLSDGELAGLVRAAGDGRTER